MAYFKRRLFKRSFELLSLYYLAPALTLRSFLTPYLLGGGGSGNDNSNKSDSASRQPSQPATQSNEKNNSGLKARLKLEKGAQWPKQIIVPDNVASVNVRKNQNQNEEHDNVGSTEAYESIPLVDFVRQHCRSLFADWDSTWWLDSGHLQTFWSSAGASYFADVDPIDYERKLLELPDGGLIAVDFTAATGEKDKETPIVIVLPGLTGGSQASYVRTFLKAASDPKEEGGLGFRGVVVNSRGCGNVPLRTPQISAGSPDDLRSALLYVRSRYPDAPIYGVGFSLGATVLSKYLGQEGESSEIRAGCVVACPWNLSRNSELMESQFFYRHVYSRALAKSYLALLNRSLPSLHPSIDPTHHFHPHLSTLLSLKSPTFTAVNTHLTAVIGGAGPTFPHPSVDEFYRWASCEGDIKGVRVPLLAINADDDPIVRVLPEEEIRRAGRAGSGSPGSSEGQKESGEGGNVVMVVTSGGGHLGWFSGREGKRRWISKPIKEWLRAVDEEIVWDHSLSSFPSVSPQHSPTPSTSTSSSSLTALTGTTALSNSNSRFVRSRIPVLDADGFTRARGEREDIGYRVLSDEEVVAVDAWSQSGGGGGGREGGAASPNGDVSIPGAMAGL